MAGYGIENSYLSIINDNFETFLKQEGSALMLATTQMSVRGATQYIRQTGVGEAQDVIDQGGTTEYVNIKNDRRLVKPTGFVCPILLDDFDMVMQGSQDPSILAADAARSCGKKIDERVVAGIGGYSFSEANGPMPLPGADQLQVAGQAKNQVLDAYEKTQTIPWNDCTFGDKRNEISVKAGLSSSKITKAIKKLREKYNSGMFVCIASEHAMLSARSDIRIACTDFNTQPSLAEGYLTPYGGCHAFIPSELTGGGMSAAKATDGTGDNDDITQRTTRVEYAYIYAVNKIILGCSMPLHMDMAKNAERNCNEVLMYKGMYGCTRLEEEAVVRIEILRDLSKVQEAAFVY